MGLYTDNRKATTTPDGYELLMHESGHLEYDFGWHLGPYWSKYLSEMRDNKRFMGTRCPECENVFIPPRAVCGRCYKPLNEWVEVGPEGTLQGFTIVRFPYTNSNNGQLMKVPFTSVWVTLDGAYTRMMHLCNELDEHKLEVGMRMRAVWAKEPRPTSIHAVEYFEVIADQEAEKVVGTKERGAPAKAVVPAKKATPKKAAKKPATRKPAKKKAAAKKK